MRKNRLLKVSLAIAMLLIAALCVFNYAGNFNPKLPSAYTTSDNIYSEDLSKYFQGYEGCFLLYDIRTSKYVIYNDKVSKERFSPCSSFKIYNSLIGLETKVLQNEDTTFKWDGKKYEFESWNKDQTLKSAVADSVVWYFEKSAAEVGSERMQKYIDSMNYGNKDISSGITNFWLYPNSLKISPREQVELLRKLYDYKLPFSRENIDIVKKIIVLSDKNDIKFSGKTGSGIIDNKRIMGWFVGYVEKGGNVYFFVTNIRSSENAGGDKAKEISIQILKDKDILK